MFGGNQYKQAELDTLAKDWQKGQAFKKDNLMDDGKYKCIHYGELFTKYGPIIDSVLSSTDDNMIKGSKKGDILFPASDVTPVGLARCSALMLDDVLLGGDIIVLRPQAGIIPEYLSWAINMQKDQLLKRVTGSVVRHMSAKGLKSVTVPIPPKEIQQHFISIVKQADKSKFMRSKSQFIEMFCSRDTTPVGNYIEDSYPGEWGTEDKDGDGVKVIRTTNFTNTGKLDLADVVTRSIIEKKIERKTIHKYDTILERSGGTTDNPVGRVVLFEEDDVYLCNNFTQVLRFKNINPRFAFYSLFYFYQTNKTAIRAMGNKTTGIQNLNMSKYLEIGIPNASEDEQHKFVLIAQQADKSKFELKKAIEAIDKVIKSLINENL